LLKNQPSLQSGAIRANTSCSAVVLLVQAKATLLRGHSPFENKEDRPDNPLKKKMKS